MESLELGPPGFDSVLTVLLVAPSDETTLGISVCGPSSEYPVSPGYYEPVTTLESSAPPTLYD